MNELKALIAALVKLEKIKSKIYKAFKPSLASLKKLSKNQMFLRFQNSKLKTYIPAYFDKFDIFNKPGNKFKKLKLDDGILDAMHTNGLIDKPVVLKNAAYLAGVADQVDQRLLKLSNDVVDDIEFMIKEILVDSTRPPVDIAADTWVFMNLIFLFASAWYPFVAFNVNLYQVEKTKAGADPNTDPRIVMLTKLISSPETLVIFSSWVRTINIVLTSYNKMNIRKIWLPKGSPALVKGSPNLRYANEAFYDKVVSNRSRAAQLNITTGLELLKLLRINRDYENQ